MKPMQAAANNCACKSVAKDGACSTRAIMNHVTTPKAKVAGSMRARRVRRSDSAPDKGHSTSSSTAAKALLSCASPIVSPNSVTAKMGRYSNMT
ncbi:hypothetical protein D3C78_1768230 [compost metagenome]